MEYIHKSKPLHCQNVITEGDFAGVIGRIKRIGGNRSVVLTVSDSQAVAIVDVHRNHLRYLTDEEARALLDDSKT